MNSPTTAQVDKSVFLAGEGNNELGSWAKEIPYQDGSNPGVLETMMKKVIDSGWHISFGKKWKDLHKYKTDENQHEDDLKGDEQSVQRACLEAKENGCQVLAFSRDIDGKKNCHLRRIRDIQRGISRCNTDFPSIKIIGGCARPTIEGWILAFSGMRGTETFSKTKAEAKLSEMGVSFKNTQEMVDFIQHYNRTDVADDARCLIQWLNTASETL